MPYPNLPPYTDQQRAQLRAVMGYSKLFKSSNTIFENVLDLIESVPAFDDGATFNESIVILNNILAIDQLRLTTQQLTLPVVSSTGAKIDAARSDAMLKSMGRSYIKQLSIIFSMKPAQDYYGRATTDLSGNVYPTSYDF